MVKIFFYSVFVWLLVSCSAPNLNGADPPMPGFVNLNLNLTYNNKHIDWPQEGFQAVENYSYGFDYIQNDNVVHISLLNDSYEDVDVYVNTAYDVNFDYYLCPTNDASVFLAEIPNKKEKFTYSINSHFGDIALCKEEKGGIYKGEIQELHVHSYEKKEYDFQVYILGDPNERIPTAENQLLNGNEFWSSFNKYYRQALIEHGTLRTKKIVSAGTRKMKFSINDDNSMEVQKNYVLSKAREVVDDKINNCSNKGDIGNIIKTIENNAQIGYPKRSIFQIGYPTKRFWPLTSGYYYVDICGSYGIEDNPKANSSLSLELEPLPDAGPECLSMIAEADVFWSGTNWKLKFKDGSGTSDASQYNADPNCVVFAEKQTKSLGTYIGEISSWPTLAETYLGSQATIVKLPWLRDRLKTTRTALHELGHAMGLLDVDDNGPYADDSEQGNLMHYNDSKTGYKLRKRSMIIHSSRNKRENQWDCLQKIDKNKNCAEPTIDKWDIKD